jgi:hypothetical protein
MTSPTLRVVSGGQPAAVSTYAAHVRAVAAAAPAPSRDKAKQLARLLLPELLNQTVPAPTPMPARQAA